MWENTEHIEQENENNKKWFHNEMCKLDMVKINYRNGRDNYEIIEQ